MNASRPSPKWRAADFDDSDSDEGHPLDSLTPPGAQPTQTQPPAGKRTPPSTLGTALGRVPLRQPQAPFTTSSPVGDANGEAELIALTQRLLEAIAAGDYATYTELCDPALTCFEPEALGGLVHGLEFHKFYFDRKRSGPAVNTTIVSPHVKLLGGGAAVVAYTRLVQSVSAETGKPRTIASEETRVWEKKGGQWVNVHFHRSSPTRD